MKWILTMMKAEDAIKFIEILENWVKDRSKSNIFIICLNPVKLGCQLIELIERLSKKFNFIRIWVNEIRVRIIEVIKKYMEDVDTH